MFRNTLLAATAIAFTLPAFAATTTTTGAEAAKPAVTAPHKKSHKKHVQKQTDAAAQSTTK